MINWNSIARNIIKSRYAKINVCTHLITNNMKKDELLDYDELDNIEEPIDEIDLELLSTDDDLEEVEK